MPHPEHNQTKNMSFRLLSSFLRTSTARSLQRIRDSHSSVTCVGGWAIPGGVQYIRAIRIQSMGREQRTEVDGHVRGEQRGSNPSTSSTTDTQQQGNASNPSSKQRKQALRKTIKSLLSQLTAEEKRAQSAAVCRAVLNNGKDNEHGTDNMVGNMNGSAGRKKNNALNLIDSLPPSSAICLYLACDKLNEVDASAILERAFASEKDIRVYLPRVLDRDSNMHFLRVHAHDTYDVVPPFGIREPTLLLEGGGEREDVLDVEERLEVIFMPGLGFGKGGERLGRGGGYYDKFVSRWCEGGKRRPLLVGLAFDEQVVEEGDVVMDAHDCWLDVLVSGSGVVHDSRNSSSS